MSDLHIQLVNKLTSPRTGIGRYAVELERGLRTEDIEIRLARPRTLVPRTLSRLARGAGYDLETFFQSYPLRVDARPGWITHLTSQTLSTLLLTQRLPRPVVITVHDIFPYLYRDCAQLSTYRNWLERWVDTVAMRGLRRADHLIAVSDYTKQTIVASLGIGPEHITVIYEPVDHDRFRPRPVPDAFYQKYGLSRAAHYVLYVGSNDPRKNLPVLIRAVACLRGIDESLNARLLLVGSWPFASEQQELLKLITQLGVEPDVLHIADVSDDDLVLFSNVATLTVLISEAEGFGLPVLEAMACGTPVIVSSRGALREVVADAGIVIETIDVGQVAQAIHRCLTDQTLAARLSQAAHQRATQFAPDRQLAETVAIYGLVQEIANSATGNRARPPQPNREDSYG